MAVIFVITSLAFILGQGWLLARWTMDYRVLLVGNGILFLATAFSLYLYSKALRSSNTQLFLRMLYSSLLIKMGFTLLATFLYLSLAGKEVSKSAILGCFGLYIVYTYLEVKVLMGMSKKQPKNA